MGTEKISPAPLVSIIIPCYNSGSFVSRAVESALNQTYGNIELILVDNNSTDNTYEILKQYQYLYPDKVRIFKEPKRGSAAARNRGIEVSKGKWLQFLDSDDEILPGKIQHQITIAARSEVEIIVGNYQLFSKYRNRKITAKKNDWIGLIETRLGITSSNLYASTAIANVGGWSESWSSSQEYELLFRLLKNGARIAFDNEFTTKIYHREESVSQTSNKNKQYKILEESIALRQAIKDFLLEQRLFDREHKKALDFYIYRRLKMSKYKSQDFYKDHFNLFQFDLPLHKKLITVIKGEIFGIILWIKKWT